MRDVSILSLCFAEKRPDLREDGILNLIKTSLNGTEDVVILPETCLGLDTINEPGDKFLSGIAELAASNKVYILAAVNRKLSDEAHANSAILYDRAGKQVMCYDKVYPYWSEYDLTHSNVTPGAGATYADTDFGRVSAAICFDANFANLWQDIADLDVDLVLFTSAYSAGTQLSAHALNHHYAIASATLKPDCCVYDIDGSLITYARANLGQSKYIMPFRSRVDLDKVICHDNFNLDKIEKMLKEHPGKVEREHLYEREEWHVIRTVDANTSAKALCREYGIEPLREYKRRSRQYADGLRAKK